MKTGMVLLFMALASCVVDPSDFAAKENFQKYQKIDRGSTASISSDKEIYPQIANPCKQDYSSMSLDHEWLTKLDCAIEKNG